MTAKKIMRNTRKTGKDGISLEKKVQTTLRRIPEATRSIDHRRHLVRSLVGAVASWNGGWTRPTKHTLKIWVNACERAVLGRITTGRSRLLSWQGKLDCWCDPEFLTHMTAIRLDFWRAKARLRQRRQERQEEH